MNEKLEKAMEGKTSYKELIIENQGKEIERLNNIINKIEEDLDYEINDYKGNIDMEEKTLSGEFCRGLAFEADYLKNRIENLKEGK